MKKTIGGLLSLGMLVGATVSFASACINIDYSKIKEGDPVPNNACPQAVGAKTYPTKEAFIKAEGRTCGTATDGVNTFFGKDFMASTMIGYPENFVAEWSCLEKKAMVYPTKEEFEKIEGQTCETATDGCNTFFVTDGKVGGGTLMYCEDIYGENGQEKWSCIDDEKEIPMVGNDKDEHGCIGSAGYSWSEEKQKCIRPWEENGLSENDANHLKLLKKELPASFQKVVNEVVEGWEKKMEKYDTTKKLELTQELINKIDTIISDLLMEYPQDIALPKKVSDKYSMLEFIHLSFMELKANMESSSVKNAKNVPDCNTKDGLEQCKTK